MRSTFSWLALVRRHAAGVGGWWVCGGHGVSVARCMERRQRQDSGSGGCAITVYWSLCDHMLVHVRTLSKTKNTWSSLTSNIENQPVLVSTPSALKPANWEGQKLLAERGAGSAADSSRVGVLSTADRVHSHGERTGKKHGDRKLLRV